MLWQSARRDRSAAVDERKGVERTAPSHPMRLAVHNIRHGLADGRHLARPWEVREAARRLDVDVAGFCEVDRRVLRTAFADQPHLLTEGLTGSASAFGAARRIGRRGEFGNLLVVRGTLDDMEVVPLPGAIGKDHRSAVFGTATVRGTRFRVAVTHLRPRSSTATTQLEFVVERLSRFDGPVVLLGDLNLFPHQVVPVVHAAGMELAGGPPTFPRSAPRARIDHVAVRGFSITKVEVPATEISDHRPLVVTLG